MWTGLRTFNATLQLTGAYFCWHPWDVLLPCMHWPIHASMAWQLPPPPIFIPQLGSLRCYLPPCMCKTWKYKAWDPFGFNLQEMETGSRLILPCLSLWIRPPSLPFCPLVHSQNHRINLLSKEGASILRLRIFLGTQVGMLSKASHFCPAMNVFSMKLCIHLIDYSD